MKNKEITKKFPGNYCRNDYSDDSLSPWCFVNKNNKVDKYPCKPLYNIERNALIPTKGTTRIYGYLQMKSYDDITARYNGFSYLARSGEPFKTDKTETFGKWTYHNTLAKKYGLIYYDYQNNWIGVKYYNSPEVQGGLTWRNGTNKNKKGESLDGDCHWAVWTKNDGWNTVWLSKNGQITTKINNVGYYLTYRFLDEYKQAYAVWCRGWGENNPDTIRLIQGNPMYYDKGEYRDNVRSSATS